jgi:hypothetical protein
MQIFHNYIRPHEALKGKTSAEVAGKVEGESKCLTLIQNASTNLGERVTVKLIDKEKRM